LVRICRNPPLDEALADAVVDLWVVVTNTGGSVGFAAPVDEATVRPVAQAAFGRVREGTDDLVVACDGGRLLGFGFLGTNDLALTGHWGRISRLQRHPGAGGAGIGRALLEALEDAARERGLERVALTARGGTGVERFYLRHGYAVEGRLPGRLNVAEGVRVEELQLSKRLDGGSDGGAGPVAGTLRVMRLDQGLPLPRYAHPGDAGLDLYGREDVTLEPGERALVPTGLAIALPPGHVGLVHPRSGLAARHGVGMVNAPGTIDEGYRGELQVLLVNLDRREPVTLRRGDRIAQLLVQRVEHVAVVEVAELPGSARGDGGFGSSGR
jgi:dUTP pyrophosphatase